MKLFTKEIEKALAANYASADESTHRPVVKLFGGGACTWLISERVDDDTHDDLVVLPPRAAYEGEMSLVEESHRWNESDRASIGTDRANGTGEVSGRGDPLQSPPPRGPPAFFFGTRASGAL